MSIHNVALCARGWSSNDHESGKDTVVVKRRGAGWRITIVAGCVAGFSAFSPVTVAADKDRPCPSGAVIELGGVSNHGRGRGHRCDDGGVLQEARVGVVTNSDTDQALDENGQQIAQAGAARPLVLPNTGGGPVDDQNMFPLLGAFAGVIAVGTGGYLRVRRSRNRVKGW